MVGLFSYLSLSIIVPSSPEKFMEINKGSVNLNKFICPKPLIIEDGTIIERER